MPTYANKTKVSSASSREEIERTLSRYGAKSFMYGWEEDRAVVGFKYNDRLIRFELPLPSLTEFERTPTGRRRTSREAIENAYEQAIRQRWRSLALAIKAKLEIVESDISTFEEEFLSKTVLPSGQTVSEWMEPQIQTAITTGAMPTLLLPAPAGSKPT